jgi:tRNA-splicing ligase RtcB
MTFKIYGEHDDRTKAQMQRCMEVGSAVKGVLCADGHLGYAHPIGGVVAYEDHISISGVGFDIGCGNMAVRLDALYKDIAPRAETILNDIGNVISFGVGRKNDERVDHPFRSPDLWEASGSSDLKTNAREQLGTVGAGTITSTCLRTRTVSCGSGAFWVAGLGHTITTRHLKAVGAKDGMEVDPALVPVNSDFGRVI